MASVIPEIARAEGCHAYDADGRRHLDLMNGFGAVFLGHAHSRVVEALMAQASRVWICGRHPTTAGAAAHARLVDVMPAGMRPAGLYSTGMEAAEYAMRVAAVATGRSQFAGFGRSMHGKSGMTAALAWDNAPLTCPGVARLPFIDEQPEVRVLEALERHLAARRVAALFVEPIQGSNAAHEASATFLPAVAGLCQAHGTMLVVDEILTGLFRTGTRFYIERVGVTPDLLLFAKCMGNGFPASSVAARHAIPTDARSMPGSTFSGNCLASAAVAATLAAMLEEPMAARVAAIEHCVRASLGGIPASVATLRGRGALWVLEFARSQVHEAVLHALQGAGILVSSHGRCIRLLPAASIEIGELRRACEALAATCVVEPAAAG